MVAPHTRHQVVDRDVEAHQRATRKSVRRRGEGAATTRRCAAGHAVPYWERLRWTIDDALDIIKHGLQRGLLIEMRSFDDPLQASGSGGGSLSAAALQVDGAADTPPPQVGQASQEIVRDAMPEVTPFQPLNRFELSAVATAGLSGLRSGGRRIARASAGGPLPSRHSFRRLDASVAYVAQSGAEPARVPPLSVVSIPDALGWGATQPSPSRSRIEVLTGRDVAGLDLRGVDCVEPVAVGSAPLPPVAGGTRPIRPTPRHPAPRGVAPMAEGKPTAPRSALRRAGSHHDGGGRAASIPQPRNVRFAINDSTSTAAVAAKDASSVLDVSSISRVESNMSVASAVAALARDGSHHQQQHSSSSGDSSLNSLNVSAISHASSAMSIHTAAPADFSGVDSVASMTSWLASSTPPR